MNYIKHFRDNWEFYFLTLSIFLLANSQVFNFFFRFGPLIIWKQLIAVVAHGIVLRHILRGDLRRYGAEKLVRFYLIFCFVTTLLAFFSILNGIPLMRTCYGCIHIAGFLPYIFYPMIAESRGKLHEMVVYVVLIGAFCGFGLVIDYFFNIYSLLGKLGISQLYDIYAEKVAFGFRRATFLFVGPNTVFPFMGMCLLFAYLMLFRASNFIVSLVMFGVVAIMSFGMFFTQSRAVWVLLVLLNALAVLYSIFFSKSKITNMLFGFSAIFMLGFLVVYSVKNIDQGMMIFDRAMNLFYSDEAGNNHRYHRWEQGFALFYDRYYPHELIFGSGIGTTARNVPDFITPHTHYENSYFRALYEGGWILFLLKLMPALSILISGLRSRGAVVSKFLIIWAGLYSLAIFAAPISGDYYNQVAIFIVVGMACIESLRMSLTRSLDDIWNWRQRGKYPPMVARH